MKEPLSFSSEQRGFESYLQVEGKRMNTIRTDVNVVGNFLAWCDEQNLDYREVVYTDLMAYINHSKALGNSKRTINVKLKAIYQFYSYLEAKGAISSNPGIELRLKGIIRRQPHDLLAWEDLEALYQEYPNRGPTGKRNKAMLGMIIYQGLHSGELIRLELGDVKLESGKVEVPQTGRNNSRILKLESPQILELQKYITQVRPVILGMAEKTTDKLFTSTGTSPRLGNSLERLIKKARQVNPQVKSVKQIRASVITYWLKHYNIRQVQYMCGHRYVSSTEHYRTDHLEALQDQIDELHPLK